MPIIYIGTKGGSDPVGQTDAADTSGAPVTVTLPLLADIAEGYVVRVYDSGANATTNNVTINAHATDGGATVATIDTDDGEAYAVVVSGAWEQRGSWPEPVAGLPTTLADICVAAGMEHVWHLPTDVNGFGDFGSLSISQLVAGTGTAPTRNIIGGIGDAAPAAWEYVAAASRRLVATSVACRSNNTSWGEILFRINSNPAAIREVCQFGGLNGTEGGLGVLRTTAAGGLEMADGYSSPQALTPTVADAASWILIHVTRDTAPSANYIIRWWRPNGTSGTHTWNRSGISTSGYATSTGILSCGAYSWSTPDLDVAHFAYHRGTWTSGHAAAQLAALGW